MFDRHSDETYVRLETDGWIVGRKTMAAYAKGTARSGLAQGTVPRRSHAADRKGRPLAVGIDPHGRLHYGADEILGDHVVAIIGEQVSDDYLAELRRDGVSYAFAGPDGQNLAAALDWIGTTFGANSLALQGGAITNGAFLKAGLIDEISVRIYPGIDGLTGVASIFECVGAPGEKPAAGQSLRHLTTETLDGGLVWIRYAVEKSPSS